MVLTGGRYVTGAFRAGSLDFEVRCSSAVLRELVEDLFHDLRGSPPRVTPLAIGLQEEVDEGKEMVRLIGASWPGPESVPADIALDLLVGAVNQLALDAEPDLLHLHAGVVARSDQCAIVCAPSGTGKSILTTELVKRGWGYLTDETAAISADGASVSGFPKPLTIKRGGRRLVPELADRAVSIECSERTSWQIPATQIGSLAPQVLQPRLIIVLDRDRDGHSGVPGWTTLEPSDAAAILLQLTLDAGRYGPSALRTIANLAHRCLCVRIEVGSPQPTAEVVDELFELPPPGALEPARWFEGPGRPGILPGFCVSSATVTVVVDGRAVVHDSVTRRVASFDEVGTGIWLALHDAGDPLASDGEAFRASSFFQTLRAEGFIVADPGSVTVA